MECMQIVADHQWHEEEQTFAERIADLRLLEQRIKEAVEWGMDERELDCGRKIIAEAKEIFGQESFEASTGGAV
eukprot:9883138-Heterocapsa_arctica.AAC.1